MNQTMKKRVTGISPVVQAMALIAFAALLFAGCTNAVDVPLGHLASGNQHSDNAVEGDDGGLPESSTSGTIDFAALIPFYRGLIPGRGDESQVIPQVIDSQTEYVALYLDGEPSEEVALADGELSLYETGQYWLWSYVFDVPARTYATVELRFLNGSHNTLTSGSADNVTVRYARTTQVQIGCLPETVTTVTADSTAHTGTLTAEHMSYFAFEAIADTEYEISITTSGGTPDVYLYNADGAILDHRLFSEPFAVLQFTPTETETTYLSVFAAPGEDAEYSLKVHPISQWSTTIGDMSSVTNVKLQMETASGGVLLAGGSDDATYTQHGGQDAVIVELDSAGNEEQHYTFGDTGDESFAVLKKTADGGYIAAGTTTSPPASGQDAFLRKLDSGFGDEWYTLIGGAADETVFDLEIACDGGYLIGAYTESFTTDAENEFGAGLGGRNAYIIKTDAEGNEEWSRILGGAGDDYARDLTTDGTNIIAAVNYNYGSGTGDLYLVSLFADGTTDWTKHYTTTDREANFMVHTASDGYVVSGTTQNWLDEGDSGDDWMRYFLLKADKTDGSMIWRKTYGDSRLEGSDFYIYWNHGSARYNGGYAIVGDEAYKDSGVSGNVDWRRFYIATTDENGDLVHDRTYPNPSDNPYNDAYTALASKDGGFLYAGIDSDTIARTYYGTRVIKSNNYGLDPMYDVTIGVDGEGHIIQDPDLSGYAAGATGEVTATPESGWVFDHWEGDISGSTNPATITMDADKTVKAVFVSVDPFSMTYGGTGDDNFNETLPTPDGGLLLIGGTSSFTTTQDAWVLKTDSAGTVEWEYAYGSTSAESFTDGVVLSDGSCVLVGSTESFGAGAGTRDFWLVKLGPDGTVVWENRYGGPNHEYAYAATETSAGDILVAGRTSSFGAGDYDGLLIKLDADGSVLWDRTYGGTGDDRFHDVIETYDGNLAIAARLNADHLIMKIDAGDGTILWQQYGGNAHTNTFTAIAEAGNHDLVTWGQTYDGQPLPTLMRFSETGVKDLEKTYSGTSAHYAHRVLEIMPDGSYLVGAQFGGTSDSEAWLLNIDTAGDIIWEKTYGSTGADLPYGSTLTSDGGIALSARTDSFGAGATDLWLLKLPADGSYTTTEFTVADTSATVSTNNVTFADAGIPTEGTSSGNIDAGTATNGARTATSATVYSQ